MKPIRFKNVIATLLFIAVVLVFWYVFATYTDEAEAAYLNTPTDWIFYGYGIVTFGFFLLWRWERDVPASLFLIDNAIFALAYGVFSFVELELVHRGVVGRTQNITHLVIASAFLTRRLAVSSKAIEWQLRIRLFIEELTRIGRG